MSGAVIRPQRREEPALCEGSVVIRPMRKEDLPQAAGIERICFSQEAWSEKVYREEFAHAGTYLWLWCAVARKARKGAASSGMPSENFSDMQGESDVPVGTISLTRTGDVGEIGNVAVLPEYRGQGIAGALLETALGYGKRQQGMSLFTLEVRAGNTAAIHLYESAGFRTEGLRPRFYTDPVEDARIMWKRDA